MLDWRNPDHYIFTRQLSSEQWAWEFLRRNPEYQKEWQHFIATWRDLEDCYGKPSQRDVQAWQRDQRAWVSAQTCLESDCRIDGDKVLIECALGARWGFYKFPPDPSDNDPIGSDHLVWREVNWTPSIVEYDQEVEDRTDQATMLFDLSMPLQPQIDHAKRRLQIEQRNRIKSGDVLAPTVHKRNHQLTLYLRLLDGLSSKTELNEIAKLLKVDPAQESQIEGEALKLRDYNYRQLLFLA
ncbi:MAG: DUF6499 domain-containing protein [Candidatus Thiodiazotropha sp. L084R]